MPVGSGLCYRWARPVRHEGVLVAPPLVWHAHVLASEHGERRGAERDHDEAERGAPCPGRQASDTSRGPRDDEERERPHRGAERRPRDAADEGLGDDAAGEQPHVGAGELQRVAYCPRITGDHEGGVGHGDGDKT